MNRLLNIARAAALAGLCSGCIIWSAAAFAADYDAVPQGTITVRAVDFTSPQAVAQLKRKLDTVAMTICTIDSPVTGAISRSQRACYDTAVKDGLTQIAGRQQQGMRERTVRLAASQVDQPSAQ